ncbi:MAG: ribosome maturation factor RimM [Acidobacteriota bacterium]
MTTTSTFERGGDDIVIARIVKARGIRGEVACSIETDFPARFATLNSVSVRMPDGARLALAIEDHWFHQHRVIVKFRGYDTMTLAGTLVGGCLVVPEGDELPLDDDQYYERGLVGSAVVTVTGREVGRVTRLMRTGGTDLLVIEGECGREHLVPFADAICTEVDVRARRITIDPPEGLLDL